MFALCSEIGAGWGSFAGGNVATGSRVEEYSSRKNEMSRSKRSEPVTGITTAESEKEWKRCANRKLWRVVTPILQRLPSADPDARDPPGSERGREDLTASSSTLTCTERCDQYGLKPAAISSGAVGVPRFNRCFDACDFWLGELELFGGDRAFGIPHNALLAGDHFALQLDGCFLVGVQGEAVLDGPDRTNGADVCALCAEEGVEVQALGVI
jgi:hypothetical protein